MSVTSLVAVVQAALPALRQQSDAAALVADTFWKLYRERPDRVVTYLGTGLAGRGRP